MPEDTTTKTELTLTPVAFLGFGCFHVFENVKSGERSFVEISEQDYNTIVGAPTLKDHVWKYSVGGAVKVDNGKGMMIEGEYTTIDDKSYICIKTKLGEGFAAPSTEVVADKIKVDSDKLIEVPIKL